MKLLNKMNEMKELNCSIIEQEALTVLSNNYDLLIIVIVGNNRDIDSMQLNDRMSNINSVELKSS